MDATKVFTSGNSQVVRIPRGLRLVADTVSIAAHALALGVPLVTDADRELRGAPALIAETWSR